MMILVLQRVSYTVYFLLIFFFNSFMVSFRDFIITSTRRRSGLGSLGPRKPSKYVPSSSHHGQQEHPTFCQKVLHSLCLACKRGTTSTHCQIQVELASGRTVHAFKETSVVHVTLVRQVPFSLLEPIRSHPLIGLTPVLPELNCSPLIGQEPVQPVASYLRQLHQALIGQEHDQFQAQFCRYIGQVITRGKLFEAPSASYCRCSLCIL